MSEDLFSIQSMSKQHMDQKPTTKWITLHATKYTQRWENMDDTRDDSFKHTI